MVVPLDLEVGRYCCFLNDESALLKYDVSVGLEGIKVK